MTSMNGDKLTINVCVLDDDQDTLDLVREEFTIRRISAIAEISFFRDPHLFINSLDNTNIAIIDQRLGGKTTGFDVVDIIQEHNKKRISKIKVIVMSGTSDMDVPIYYLNQQKARFYIRKKNDDSYIKGLADSTEIAIEEVIEDMCFETRHNQRRDRAEDIEQNVNKVINAINESR